FLTRYFRYVANLARLGKAPWQVACYVRACHLVAPALPGGLNYDLNALALLLRDWATDELLVQHPLVTCLIADNLNDLHPLIVQNPRVGKVQVPQPAVHELRAALAISRKFSGCSTPCNAVSSLSTKRIRHSANGIPVRMIRDSRVGSIR